MTAGPASDVPVVDAHAHLLPREVWDLPHTAAGLRSEGDRVLLGAFDLAVTPARLAEVDVLLADMDAHGIDVRVVSPPPYAFPVGVEAAAAADWCARVSAALVAACATAPDRLVPFGCVPTQHEDEAVSAVRALPGLGAAGVALPPLVGDVPVGEGPGAATVLAAAALGLPVLLHPMQQPGPGLSAHYLRNLLGNPVETAVGLASLLLGGLTATPGLRVLAVHGGGCVPAVVGRWDHGRRVRGETGAGLGDDPSRLLLSHEVYADLLTHDARTVATTTGAFGADHVVLGSDYPFDMGDADPLTTAVRAGVDVTATTRNARRWLGLPLDTTPTPTARALEAMT
ncbi:amidohydrolase family protein [Aquipuribacter sp. MA13-6]|uniref:amidohydrolase family protein n=1 Tax=unclassified Aquipuribacter TaxID=2635084 RepID=UPI003EEFE18F